MKIFCLFLAAFCSPAFSGEWTVNVEKELDALVSSCIVIPCTFTHPKENLPSSKLRKIWHRSNDRDAFVFNDDKTRILENFRGRTQLLGAEKQDNCTLEITDIRNHDNGPFCFRIELARTENDMSTPDKFSFVENCVKLNILPEPPKPSLVHPETAKEGHPYTVTCVVSHTCPSHAPTLTWSRSTPDGVTQFHRKINPGLWEIHSTLTFIPEEKDDHSEVTCTAVYNGGKRASETVKLYIKRIKNYNHIIIPTVVGISISVIFVLLGIFTVKKYKNRITELQNRDGSMWNRLSQLSRRIHSAGPQAHFSDQRGSIWRFSRNKGNTQDCSHMPSNAKSQSSNNHKITKPRFPSPKSQLKSYNYKEDLDNDDDYVNTADLNIYANN